MSDVGSVLFDKDAFYISIPDHQISFTKIEGAPVREDETVGEKMVKRLQDAQFTIDQKLQESEVQLFKNSKPIRAIEDLAAMDEDEEEDDVESDDEEMDGEEDEEEGAFDEEDEDEMDEDEDEEDEVHHKKSNGISHKDESDDEDENGVEDDDEEDGEDEESESEDEEGAYAIESNGKAASIKSIPSSSRRETEDAKKEKLVFADEESDDDVDDDIPLNLPDDDDDIPLDEDDEDNEATANELKWKDNIIERAAKQFKRVPNIMELVYGAPLSEGSNRNNQDDEDESDEDEDDTEFFKIKKKSNIETANDALDSSKYTPQLIDWSADEVRIR